MSPPTLLDDARPARRQGFRDTDSLSRRAYWGAGRCLAGPEYGTARSSADTMSATLTSRPPSRTNDYSRSTITSTPDEGKTRRPGPDSRVGLAPCGDTGLATLDTHEPYVPARVTALDAMIPVLQIDRVRDTPAARHRSAGSSASGSGSHCSPSPAQARRARASNTPSLCTPGPSEKIKRTGRGSVPRS